MERISDDDLAYLNENHNLVAEYIQHHDKKDILVLCRDKPTCTHITRASPWPDRVQVVTGTRTYAPKWRDLLEYIDDHSNNAHFVLK